ncbi:MAG: Lrp/AsnC family transcriptional regulator [Clostridia bacterium]|nr:Lrp/AsnC family transcriptional regulator [Clostridia bacterium]
MNDMLRFLEKDGRLTPEELAVMCGKDVEEIKSSVNTFERDGVILGYQAIIDWDKTDKEYVNALIELKITPRRDKGFEAVAEKISNYPEVQSLYLMSGGFDLMLVIEGKTMKEVAYFVAEKLATLEDVIATSTHFVLRKYKDKGIVYGPEQKDERGNQF